MPTVIYAESGTFVICQEWNIVGEWWRLFSENGDAITGQKRVKKGQKWIKHAKLSKIKQN